jgi:hypothetical protein
VYAACLFCNTRFDRNESIEAFPIGRRLAFDAAKGRLWVVCRRCERWCLTPLDERWEAIDQAERLFRDSRRRVTTDNIGLAKLPDGTTLVRIGKPLRPELAAWRYGDQFGRRRRRSMLLGGGAVGSIWAVGAIGVVAGGAVALGVGLLGNALQLATYGHPWSIVARLREPGGSILRLRLRHIGASSLSRADDGSLAVAIQMTKSGPDSVKRFEGAEARRVMTHLMPPFNCFGGDKYDVAIAANEIEAAGSAERFVDSIATTADQYSRTIHELRRLNPKRSTAFTLGKLRRPQQLALEMALHEDAERRALEGELAELERAWRDAEEIAGIADNLTVPAAVDANLDRMKGR